MATAALESLNGALLIQCRPSDVREAAEIAGARGGGLVISGSGSLKHAELLRDNGFVGPILCDAERYKGATRRYGGSSEDTIWCSQHLSVNDVALTDSGFLAHYDIWGLEAVLDHAAAQRGPTIAMLPLSRFWFRRPAIDTLIRAIVRRRVPVAVAIEHGTDPFSAMYIVGGFLNLLLRLPVPVLLLRSDMSALGAICHGAHAAAIGTTTGLRHISPVSAGGPGAYGPQVAAFIRHLLCYRRIGNITEAAQQTPDYTEYWECDCPECGGRPLSRLSAEDRKVQESAAFRHSMHALFDIHHELVRPESTLHDRKRSWASHVSHALFLHEELANALPAWSTPAFLVAWQRVVGDAISRGARAPATDYRATPPASGP